MRKAIVISKGAYIDQYQHGEKLLQQLRESGAVIGNNATKDIIVVIEIFEISQ